MDNYKTALIPTGTTVLFRHRYSDTISFGIIHAYDNKIHMYDIRSNPPEGALEQRYYAAYFDIIAII
jgi:hypothetical protein